MAERHCELVHEVRGEDGERLQSGRTVQVMYDYAAGRTTRIPGAVRAAVEALDGPFAHGGAPGAR